MMRLLRLAVFGLTTMLLLPSALPSAMAMKGMKPPESSFPIWQWGATVVLAGACALIMFKNAKRSHQD